MCHDTRPLSSIPLLGTHPLLSLYTSLVPCPLFPLPSRDCTLSFTLLLLSTLLSPPPLSARFDKAWQNLCSLSYSESDLVSFCEVHFSRCTQFWLCNWHILSTLSLEMTLWFSQTPRTLYFRAWNDFVIFVRLKRSLFSLLKSSRGKTATQQFRRLYCSSADAGIGLFCFLCFSSRWCFHEWLSLTPYGDRFLRTFKENVTRGPICEQVMDQVLVKRFGSWSLVHTLAKMCARVQQRRSS